MFAIIFLWTPPHFWALAISYTHDYAEARVPMLPVTRGATEARRRSFVYAVVTVLTSLALYPTGAVGLVYLTTALITGGLFVWLAWRQIKLATTQSAMTLFRYSTTYLGFIFAAMLVDRLLPL
jgi:protoheme IX farnesyltransferase